jgi:hypothetical protein
MYDNEQHLVQFLARQLQRIPEHPQHSPVDGLDTYKIYRYTVKMALQRK